MQLPQLVFPVTWEACLIGFVTAAGLVFLSIPSKQLPWILLNSFRFMFSYSLSISLFSQLIRLNHIALLLHMFSLSLFHDFYQQPWLKSHLTLITCSISLLRVGLKNILEKSTRQIAYSFANVLKSGQIMRRFYSDKTVDNSVINNAVRSFSK